MRRELRYRLVCEGVSDRCLLRIIDWLCFEVLAEQKADAEWILDGRRAEFWHLVERPDGLKERLRAALADGPCDVLFVHRDADRGPRSDRLVEIQRALSGLKAPPHVAVIPVRETEAWLLCSEHAIRLAADNPRGRRAIPLPPLARIEACADPKEVLRRCLEAASEKQGRDLKRFQRDLPERVQRVAHLIDDFSPLRRLSAFTAFEEEARRAVRTWARAALADRE